MSSFLKAAKRHSEHFVGSVLKSEDLSECIGLSDVNGLIVEMDEPTGEIQFGTFDIPIVISFLNGVQFLRGRYTHRSRTVTVCAAGEEETMFSVTLVPPPRIKHPAVALAGPTAVDKKLSVVPHALELAKLKHRSGVCVFRINKSAHQRPRAAALLRDEASDLQILRPNQSVPYLDIHVEKGCCSTLMHWIGLTFSDTYFACYKGDAFIGTISPKISCGFTRYAYVINFENNNIPSPTHLPKVILLSSAIVMLMNLGPLNIIGESMEEA